MIPQADKLIEKASKGERLAPKERRHCIAYLMGTQPDMTNTAMAELFRVSEAQIRKDRISIREERAKSLKEEDIALVIADIALSFDRQVRDIETSKKKCKLGERTYLEHCKAIFEFELKKVKALQDLGYYPKNLGNMTVNKYEYRAVVAQDGSVDTRPVNLIIDAEPEDAAPIAEAEFEMKALPAPEVSEGTL